MSETQSPGPDDEAATLSVRLELSQVASWKAAGANETVTAKEITDAIGEAELARFADALGKEPAELAEQLAERLPQAVDNAFPAEPAAATSRAHPAPDVLLLLFDDVPDTIVIREPGEGIQFGLPSADA
ncbi:YidB family protein [Streptomyces sp. NPDC020719]|uniref:YidB family protein n=1 Tax=Streptomyces sp. NPDC020719 TaxID=3154896 RepID=UPI0033DA64E6